MTSPESSLKSNSDEKSDKKGTTTAGTDAANKDGTHNGDGADKSSQQHDSSVADPTTKLHEDTWFSRIVDGAKHFAESVYDDVTGQSAPEKKVIKTDDIDNYNFSMDIFKSDAPAKPAGDATKDVSPSSSKADVSTWFNKMGAAAEDVGGKISGHVSNALDWLFSSTDKAGNEATVSAKNGEAHVKGKNQDGVAVDVKVDKHVVEGEAGSVRFRENKDTKEGDYQSRSFEGKTEGDTKKIVDQRTKNTFEWDEKTQKGFLADPSGKHLLEFDSKEQLTQELSKNRFLSQTQERADCAADRFRARMQAGLEHLQTRLVVDKDGDTAVVRSDGLMVKTYKSDGYVTIEKDGHTIKIQNNEAFVQREDPTTHAKEWVAMHGRHFELPKGMQIDANTGAVSVNGKEVVTAKGNVEADDVTHIDTKTGKLTTTSDTGPVTVENQNGRTTVTHPGVGTIVNDGHTFINTDPKTRDTFASMDSDSGQVNLFRGENGSGVNVDLKPGGMMTFTEPDGQVTQMNNQGYFNSCDAQGHSLVNIDTYGNVSTYDGTRIGSDGTVSNRYGVADAWDNGQSAAGAITNASSAILNALSASAIYDPSGSSLAALDSASSELSSLAQTYTAMGRLDLVAQITSTMGSVDAARSKVLQVVSVSRESERRLGDGSSSRVKEALASGSPENYIQNQEQRRRTEVA